MSATDIDRDGGPAAPVFSAAREIAHPRPRDAVKARARRLAGHCAERRGSEPWRSALQLLVTASLFFASWAAMTAAAVHAVYWPVALLSLPTAGLMVRMFIFQHDCGHGSFWPSRRANLWTGRLISLVTFTPYELWRREHALHHSRSGDLARRFIGDIDTLTVREYQALPLHRRLFYRLYRNPFMLVFVGGPAYFFLRHRLPLDTPFPAREIWPSVALHTLAVTVLYGGLIWLVGARAFLIATLAFMLPAMWVGIWMFFIQHQYEEACWYQGSDWDYHAAAMLGSSYYVLPPVLQWFTGNIGLHHVHHLCPAVPNYKLQECIDSSRELRVMNRLTLRESFRCGRLALWDEDERRLKAFSELR